MRKGLLKAGLIGAVLAFTGCTSINGVLMSREVGRGLDNSAYALGISKEQAAKDANADGNKYLTQEEHNNYRLNHIGEFRVQDLPTIPKLAKIIGLPTEPPYDPDRENR